MSGPQIRRWPVLFAMIAAISVVGGLLGAVMARYGASDMLLVFLSALPGCF